jgi:hypothetical protein
MAAGDFTSAGVATMAKGLLGIHAKCHPSFHTDQSSTGDKNAVVRQ